MSTEKSNINYNCEEELKIEKIINPVPIKIVYNRQFGYHPEYNIYDDMSLFLLRSLI